MPNEIEDDLKWKMNSNKKWKTTLKKMEDDVKKKWITTIKIKIKKIEDDLKKKEDDLKKIYSWFFLHLGATLSWGWLSY
jgi:hypothetical protein